MSPPGGWLRFRLLMGLRLRLLLRAQSRSAGRLVAFLLAFVFMGAWALMLGAASRHLVLSLPHHQASFAHFAFFAVFLTQVVLGVVTLAVSEFYDISRIMHLPLGYREVFSAMAVSGFLAPINLVYAAPAVGCALAMPGGTGTLLLRALAILALLLLGHVVALVLNFLLLSFLTKRKLRDVATIVASLLGVGFYLVFRSFQSGNWAALIESNPTASLRWLPTAWLAELFVGEASAGDLLLRGAGALSVMIILVWLGSRALRAAFLGQLPSPSLRPTVQADRKRREWLPGDMETMVRTARQVYFREPQMKALYLQQTIFLLAPVAFLQLDPQRTPTAGHLLIFLIPFLLALSHMVFVQSLFGLDGRGLGLLLLSPVPRWRILLSRGIAVGGFFLFADLILLLVALLAAGLLRGEMLDLLRLAPKAYIATVLFNFVVLALGTVTSVLWPVRLGSAGRRPIQGQRAENTGCTAQLIRLVVFFPAVLLGAALAFFALLPVLELRTLRDWIPPTLVLVTVPVAFAVALVLYGVAVLLMGRRMERTEEQMVRALLDTGD